MWLKALFLFQNVLVFEGNSYVCWKKWRYYFPIFLFQKLWFSRIIALSVEKMKILDNFMIAYGKECD